MPLLVAVVGFVVEVEVLAVAQVAASISLSISESGF